MKNDFPRIVVPPEIAREFRKAPTAGERILWNALRGRQLDGLKFRRQQPIGYFVVDFYNSANRLIVEVDGPIHELQKEADQARQEILQRLGLEVLRIPSETVETHLSSALSLIRNSIYSIQQSKESVRPSPFMGEGMGGGS